MVSAHQKEIYSYIDTKRHNYVIKINICGFMFERKRNFIIYVCQFKYVIIMLDPVSKRTQRHQAVFVDLRTVDT